jgi:hypothetical protein
MQLSFIVTKANEVMRMVQIVQIVEKMFGRIDVIKFSVERMLFFLILQIMSFVFLEIRRKSVVINLDGIAEESLFQEK